MKGECNGPTGLLLAQAQARLRYQCKAEAVGRKRSGIEESFGNYQESSLGKIRTQLGRTVSDNFDGRNRCILFGGPR